MKTQDKSKKYKTLISFLRRWNTTPSQHEMEQQFKAKSLNCITEVLGDEFCKSIDLRNEYLKRVGHPLEIMPASVMSASFYETSVYKILADEQDFSKYLWRLEEILSVHIRSLLRDSLIRELKSACAEIDATISVQDAGHGHITVYIEPDWAVLLDDNVINRNLAWLRGYPEAYNSFEASLLAYQDRNVNRNLLDNLRFSLEQLLKVVLINNKPLEKQGAHLKSFLKAKKISQEIINMFNTLIGYFKDYQNDKVKHSEKYNPNEAEFMIYLTGTFMRLLIQANR
jgi:hypothetical protein